MTKEFQPITWEKIKKAEGLRYNGKPLKAIDEVKEALIPPEKIIDLEDKDFLLYLLAWRIIVDSNTSLTKRAIGKKTVDFALETKEVIQNYYLHPQVLCHNLSDPRKDPENNSFIPILWMLRDKGRYNLAVAAFTGNPEFIKKAINCFDIITKITEDPIAKGLAEIEVGMIENNYELIKLGHDRIYGVYEKAEEKGSLDDAARWAAAKLLKAAREHRQPRDIQKAWQESLKANRGQIKTLIYLITHSEWLGNFKNSLNRQILKNIDVKQLKIE